jgi:hypothetical protein
MNTTLTEARREILTAIQNEQPPQTETEAFTRYRVVAGMLQSYPELIPTVANAPLKRKKRRLTP